MVSSVFAVSRGKLARPGRSQAALAALALAFAPTAASADGGGDPTGAPALWLGFAVVGGLLASFAALGWWLFLSPGGGPVRRPPTSDAHRRARQRLVLLYLGGMVTTIVAAMWDASWHARVGLQVEDFFWPPHLLLYGGFGLNAAIGAFGLARLLRLPGGLRARFRAEPLYGFMALASAYQMLSGPSDEIWHRLLGKDLTVWSLPHALLIGFSVATLLAGVALQADLLPRRGRAERALFGYAWQEGVVVALLAIALWGLTLYGVFDWEYFSWAGIFPPDNAFWSRPAWTYVLAGLAAGAFIQGTAVHALRRAGAGVAVALTFVAAYGLALGALAAAGELTPVVATPLFQIPAALALAAVYRGAPLGDRAGQPGRQAAAGLAFAAAYLALALPATFLVTRLVTLGPGDVALAAVLGATGGPIAHLLGAAVGAWLRELPARLAERRPNPAPPPAQAAHGPTFA